MGSLGSVFGLSLFDIVLYLLWLIITVCPEDANLCHLYKKYTRKVVLVSSPKRVIQGIIRGPGALWDVPGYSKKQAAIR